MIIAVGCDSCGIYLKDILIDHLHEKDIKTIDVGSYAGKPKRRYYEVASDVAQLIQSRQANKGLLLCGTGMGVSIVANKFRGIYAACIESEFSALKAKQINNANVLCMGPIMISEWRAKLAVDNWLVARHTDEAANKEVADFLIHSLDVIADIESMNFK